MKKRSFFQKLTGGVPLNDDFDDFEEEQEPAARPGLPGREQAAQRVMSYHEEEPTEGQLPIDMYQTQDEIIIRTFTAGVRPDEMNVSISRDMVVLEGSRQEREQVTDGDYFSRELFWGSFTRTILLPEEVDVDTCTATAKDGLLTLVLPKLDKARQTKLKVRVG
ncbi:MAG: Hsp20/alpha crystallin family protein [Patescibacteria group bacterium]